METTSVAISYTEEVATKKYDGATITTTSLTKMKQYKNIS